jgi:predicted RNA-binding Zn-ribbon protein involved in translation (DUF1610 family)
LDVDDRANDLYWGSDRSVNQIAEDLDLSKGALYEIIRPLPAGFYCPACDAELVHSNRTARDRGRVDCPVCGWDGVDDDAQPFDVGRAAAPSDAVRPGRATADMRPSPGDTEPVDDAYAMDDYDRTGPLPPAAMGDGVSGSRLIAGGALLGAAVGLALVIWARRR